MTASILGSIKVLDLSRIIAGPMCAQNLADMGATVYKIEKPREGDDTRHMGPFLPKNPDSSHPPESATFLAYNRGKRSITVDLAQPEGVDLVRALAAQCDVVIENYKVGTLKKYGLDYASLREIRPDLIYCSVTGYGQSGPYAKRPAYDFITQGLAGLMSTCGEPDGPPLRTSIPITDLATGLYATIAILGALYHRQQTGTGQYIDTALLDASVALNGHLAQGFLSAGKVPQRWGNTNPIAAPSEVFSCADGELIVAAGNNGQFAALCRALGCDELAQDERFATNSARIQHVDALRNVLRARMAQFKRADLAQALITAGVPSGSIHTVDEVFSNEQVIHRELALNIPIEGRPDQATVRSPLRFSATPVQHQSCPQLGQHTEQVLSQDLQLSAEKIAALKAKAVI